MKDIKLELEQSKKQLETLTLAIAKLKEKCAKKRCAKKKCAKKECKASETELETQDVEEEDDMMEEMLGIMREAFSYVYASIDNVCNYVTEVEREVYSHASSENPKITHLPKLSASQMNKLLKNCGGGEDYVCEPKVVYAGAKKGWEIELNGKK